MVWRGNRGGPRGGRFNHRRGNRGRTSNVGRSSEGVSDPGPRLNETDVGITEYLRSEPGFHGLIKSRYSDFHVSEISSDGELAKLTDISIPVPPNSSTGEVEDEELDVLNKYNTEVLTIEQWDKINAAAMASPKAPEKVEIDVTGMEKGRRTKIHECVQKAFGNKKVVGSTITKGDKKYIVFTTFNRESNVDVREKWPWCGDFVHFILYKENCDTMEAVSRIAENLNMRHIKPALFGYSGTKDRRGKTSQWVSIKKVKPAKIINCCKPFHYITVGNFSFKNYNLKLGDLKGNRFKIALRNVTVSNEIIQCAVESIKEKGFVNYYGLQRFGSRADIPTFMIGKLLLQGFYKEAVQFILKPHGPFHENLKIYESTGNAQKALQGLKFLRHPSIEMKLLLALKNEEVGGSTINYINILNVIPRNTRLLYIHSYQSYIWNMCVSERLKRFGLKCHVGDIVLSNPKDVSCNEIIDDFIETFDDDSSKMDEENSQIDKESKDGCDTIADNATEKNDDTEVKTNIVILTEENINSNPYSIFDVVLPLPGFNIEYPPNMKEYYKELLEKDNLKLELKQKNKSYSLSGAYRHIVKKPDNLMWKCVRYSDPFADLILSDLDELRRKEPIKDVTDGKFKALILEFDLPSSTYATMVLRELLKTDTSSEVQAQSNNYHLNKSETKQNSEAAKETDGCVEKRKIEEGQIETKKMKVE